MKEHSLLSDGIRYLFLFSLFQEQDVIYDKTNFSIFMIKQNSVV